MSEKFTKQTLRVVVSQICQTIGWHSIQTSSLETLIDVLHRYLEEIARTSHLYADQFGRTRPNLDDLGLAFNEMGIELKELEEYVDFVESVPCNVQVPKYPLAKESHLNFLKPGSKEVVTRPVYVHEHLPPTVLETEEEYSQPDGPLVVDTAGSTSIPLQTSPQGVFKRPGDPIESPAAKRARLFLEEEGRPLREISSVMMTTGGLLSPAREGKLPEAKVVLPMSDSRSVSPQPSSYPSVPPEVNREKKKKSSGDGVKSEKKKEKKIVEKVGESGGEPVIKKLAGMKEMEKLKALKSNALKMAPRYPHPQNKAPRPGSNKIMQPDHHSAEKSLIQKLSESPHLVVTPVQPTMKRPSPPAFETKRDSGITIAKLTNEPDTQKLNVFKKIAKVKEEKIEKIEKHDFSNLVPPISRERSPGLIIEEVRRPRSALEMVESLPKEKKESRPKPEPRTPDITHIYDDDLSSPGSPSTPKTPEIMRKAEKSPEHKKKKKDKEKKKRKNTPKEKIKIEDDFDRAERPKTPEILEPPPPLPKPRDTLPPGPVFPFFPHFPPVASGLIPPPLANPLIPRFPLPLNPNFPNLPLPPPLLMQQPIKMDDLKKEKSDKPLLVNLPSGSPPTKEKEGKSPLAILLNRDKEKKIKEHKRDKKDKDKIKKKKDKKEKIKKEKGEKKHKDEKYKEHKLKEKKEKKIKKKEKLKVDKIINPISVPKLTLKLGPSSPRPPSPDPKLKKLLSKPSKRDDEFEDERPAPSIKREPSPEIARISSLFNKPPKSSLTKPLHVQTEMKPTLSIKEVQPIMKSPGTVIDKDGERIWICPACGKPDDGSPMIGCDECDAWYHWVCVGIQVPPGENEDWYCRFCIAKKQEPLTEKKKRGRKKKPPV